MSNKPIISREDFLKINAVASEPTKTKDVERKLPLISSITCCECHKPLTRFLVKKKKLYHYKCRTKAHIGTKSANNLNDMFFEKLSHYKLYPRSSDVVLKEIVAYIYDEQTKELRKEEAELKKQLIVLESKIESVEERFAVGKINVKVYEKLSTKFEK